MVAYIRNAQCISRKVVNFEFCIEDQQLDKFEKQSSRLTQVKLTECRVNHDLTCFYKNMDKSTSRQLSLQINQEQNKLLGIGKCVSIDI